MAAIDAVREVAASAADDVDKHARFPRETLAALREARLLSAYIPSKLGGGGCSVLELAEMCQALGRACGASALIFAMHQIQIGCLVRHGLALPFVYEFLERAASQQALIGSVTSETGVGGDLRTSRAALTPSEHGCSLEKESPTISYGQYADALLVTARRSPDAVPGDQVLALVERDAFTLEPLGDWQVLGMRGTCSPAFRLRATFGANQVLEQPFGDIAPQTMVPLSHILWSACWLGIARDAAARARLFVRTAGRRDGSGATPHGSTRLAELSAQLETLRGLVDHAADRYQRRVDQGPEGMESLASLSSVIAINTLKVSASQLTVDIVGRALGICGMAGYSTGSPFSLGRHLRDAYSAGIMINNDRILATNATLLMAVKDT